MIQQATTALPQIVGTHENTMEDFTDVKKTQTTQHKLITQAHSLINLTGINFFLPYKYIFCRALCISEIFTFFLLFLIQSIQLNSGEIFTRQTFARSKIQRNFMNRLSRIGRFIISRGKFSRMKLLKNIKRFCEKKFKRLHKSAG